MMFRFAITVFPIDAIMASSLQGFLMQSNDPSSASNSVAMHIASLSVRGCLKWSCFCNSR